MTSVERVLSMVASMVVIGCGLRDQQGTRAETTLSVLAAQGFTIVSGGRDAGFVVASKDNVSPILSRLTVTVVLGADSVTLSGKVDRPLSLEGTLGRTRFPDEDAYLDTLRISINHPVRTR